MQYEMIEQVRVLLVDDNQTNLTLFSKLVEKIPACVAIAFSDPKDFLSATPELDFDIAVIDYEMPGHTGLELLAKLTELEKYSQKSFVIVTSHTDTATRMAALNSGAIDFLTKPVNPLEFQARIRNLAALADARKRLADKAEWLHNEVNKAVVDLREREEEIIERLSIAASFKDPETGMHTRRVASYCEAIARAYGLPEKECSDIRLAAPMHDIGKVGIPDAVLLKRGAFSAEERAAMQEHATIGYDILRASKSNLLRLAADIARSHHERWDGRGYPSQLGGLAIPLPGRIAAIADNFDALTTARPYKEAWSVEKTVQHIRSGAGTQFDPRCVEAFDEALPAILRIMLETSDYCRSETDDPERKSDAA